MLIKLYFSEIVTHIKGNEFYRMLSYLPKEQINKIESYHFENDRKLSLYSQLLVRAMICKYTNLCPSEIELVPNQYGKPYLEKVPNFYFNLSHTRDAIVVAISDSEIGVDVEKIQKSNLQIAKRFYTNNEFSYVMENQEQIDYRFYEVWTKKESYSKYVGKGLSLPFRSFDVLDNSLANQFVSFFKGEYILSVCKARKDFLHDLIELSEGDIEQLSRIFL